MAKKEIDKKSLDAEITNALLDDFDKFENFAMTHWKGIIAVCVVVVIGVAVYSTLTMLQRKSEEKMISTLTDAKKIDGLEKALGEYPDSPASVSARLRLADLYRKDKKYAEAAGQLAKVAATANIPALQKYRAKLDIAYLDELSGNSKDAAAKFSAVTTDAFAPQSMKCEAAYAAGRLYLALKDNTKAIEYLQSAVNTGVLNKTTSDFAVDIWQRQAKALLLTVPVKATAVQK